MRILPIYAVTLLTLGAATCTRTAPPKVDTVQPAARPAEDPRPAAQEAAGRWLSLVDRAMYTESWDSAATGFRRATSKLQWRNSLLEARNPFEPVGQRTLIESKYPAAIPNAPPGDYVLARYETQVSGARKATEMVTLTRDVDGRWRVTGYSIRSR
jgi:hypothetical protein